MSARPPIDVAAQPSRAPVRGPRAGRVSRWTKNGALLAALVLGGCHGCKSVDYPVSSAPADSGGDHRRFPQSETSMVRIDQPERPRGEPAARFLAAYNDATAAMSTLPAPACWIFDARRPSLDGWAISEAFGGDWFRQEQLPVSGALRERGVRARHGDPWLAAWSSKSQERPGIVLYVSVAQERLERDGPRWFLLLTRSRDNGQSFEDSFVLLGPQGAVPDGPKVAITGDGRSALVVWDENALAGIPFRIVWNLEETTLMTSATAVIDPLAVAAPPAPGCTLQGVAVHPRVAAGLDTFYVAANITYRCGTTFEERVEVYRNPAIGLAFGAPWRRILSAEPPPSIPSGFGILNAQDAAGTPRFGTRVDRGSSLPALAVGQDADGEFVVVADLVVKAGALADEAHSEKVVLFRLGQADTCDAEDHQGDLDSCGQTVAGQDIDALATPGEMPTVADRAGIWESKPALFTGKVPDGTVDRRVGVVWYSQPYKGRLSVTDEMRARTIVEAAVSRDAGRTFEGPFNLADGRDRDRNLPEDPAIGPYFHPCQMICSGYYGEYVSGVFQFADPGPTAIVASWGDSREGCTDQSATNAHHHVWAGAVRPY